MPILNYTTKVDVHTTISEIQRQLVKHGASRIYQDYDPDGSIAAMTFVINTPSGMRAVRLPANVRAVQSVLQRQKVKCDMAQAERVAWRIVKDWVEAQMAILESEMVQMEEIFFPYMISDTGQTLFEVYKQNQLRLEGGSSDGSIQVQEDFF